MIMMMMTEIDYRNWEKR